MILFANVPFVNRFITAWLSKIIIPGRFSVRGFKLENYGAEGLVKIALPPQGRMRVCRRAALLCIVYITKFYSAAAFILA